MLSPEVWKFSPPPCNIVCKSGVFEEKGDICENVIEKHYFNHLVSVVLPNTVFVPSPIIETLNEDSAYYKAVGVDISELVSKEFLDAFVKQGQLSVLSDKTHIDVDDCVCITPCGHLVLCLQRETYLELGLEGKPSFFSQNKPSKYIVKIDLKASHFIPGKKNYDRVLWCLQENLKLKFDLLIAWESPDDKICPSSVAAYLHSRGYEVSVCQPRFTRRLDYNVLVPELGNNGENDCSPMDLLEWLGSFSLNVDMKSGSPSNYLTTYQTPVGAKMCGQIASLQWTGYFTTRKLMKLFESLRSKPVKKIMLSIMSVKSGYFSHTDFREILKYATEKDDYPWISLYVQGFADSPVSWGLKEHNFFLDGDNEYTIFMQAKNFIACSVLSSNKRPK